MGAAPPACAPTPPPACVATAGCDPGAFLGTDTKTQGSFQGVYGASGHKFLGLGMKPPATLPAFVQSVNVSGAREWAWPAMSTAV